MGTTPSDIKPKKRLSREDQSIVDAHLEAARHHNKAASHHKDAAKYSGIDAHEQEAESLLMAQGHDNLAKDAQSEVAKYYAEHY